MLFMLNSFVDAENTNFKDNTFDVVFCRWTLHHVKNVHKFVAEMTRVCKPGGYVVIIDLESPENQVQFSLLKVTCRKLLIE